jgi:hypothetical protein
MYVNDAGKSRVLTNGVSLDLTSTVANITIGENLIDGSATIRVGNETKEVTAGSKVTAAEYAALAQSIATGNQGLTLTGSGAAQSGSLNLNLVSDNGANIRASELVVPKDVTVSGDFGRAADGVRVTKDLVNYGTVLATSSNSSRNTAVISARDINNQQGASISSQSSLSNPELNLALRADRDINNDGSISSVGSLELSAGHAINNHGSVSAAKDVTLTGANDSMLSVNNTGGVINANGAINFRQSDYSGFADSTLYGGNLLSGELNINAGQGSGNVFVNELTGKVTTTGAAAHVTADTENLILGEQCLTGDPTYFNTGNITIGGNITVQENLAIVAGGNITSNVSNLNITANSAGQGFNIVIVAGTNVTGSGTQTGGPISGNPPSGNTTANISFKDPSATGGNIDFSAATNMSINSRSTSGNFAGGNLLMAAYSNAALTANGDVLLPATSTIDASGSGTGNNGNVQVFAGRSIQLGQVTSNAGTGAGGSDILIVNSQPKSSDNNPLIFNTNGVLTSGNTLEASGPLGTGNVTVGAVNGRNSVFVSSGGTLTMGAVATTTSGIVRLSSEGDMAVSSITGSSQMQLTSRADVTFNDALSAANGIVIVASGDILSVAGGVGTPSLTANAAGNSGSISLIAGTGFSFAAGVVNIEGQVNSGGSIDLTTGSPITNFSSASTLNGSGGDINVVAFNGEVHLPTTLSLNAELNGTGLSAGDVVIVASGQSASPTITIGGVRDSGGNALGTGSITIQTTTPSANPGSPVEISTNGANFGQVTSGTLTDGAITFLSGIAIGGTLESNGSSISINTGVTGVALKDVENFGLFRIFSSGNITVLGGTNHRITGAGEGANVLTFASANGSISFDSQILLHATGSGSPLTGGGGGITLIAKQNVQSIDSAGANPGLDAGSAFTGGNIAVVAGANFFQDAFGFTVTGGSAASGSILFDGNAVGFTGTPLQNIDTSSFGAATFNGGNVNIISFGSVNIPSATFDASGINNGFNGDVSIVGSTGLTVPQMAFNGIGGSLTMQAATPGVGVHLNLSANVDSGSFFSGPLASTNLNFAVNPFATSVSAVSLSVVTLGSISFQQGIDLRSTTAGVAGGDLLLESGFNVFVNGNINVSNITGNGDAGSITLISHSATVFDVGGGGANSSGTLTANAGTVGSGGAIQVANTGGGGVKITTAPSQNVTDGNGADLILNAGSGLLDLSGIGGTITRSAVGADHDGGEINLQYGTLTGFGGGAITLIANGTGFGEGGRVFVTGGGNLIIGGGAGEFVVSTIGFNNNGNNSFVNFNAGGSLTQDGSLNSAFKVLLTSGTTLTMNTAIVTFDLKASAGTVLTSNASISSDQITFLSKGNTNLNGDLTTINGIVVVAGGNIGTSISLDLDSTETFQPGGDIVIAAGANFTDGGSIVTINGSSATGGNILFNTVGALNSVTTSSGTGASGKLTMLAFANGVGTGGIVIPAGANIDTRSSAGPAGDITIIGGAASGTAVNMGGLNTSFNNFNNGTGAITILGATPNPGISVVTQGSNTGSYSGTFASNNLLSGTVTVGNLTTGYAPISVRGGSVSVGAVTGNPYVNNFNGADVTIESRTAGSLTVGAIVASGSGNGSGGHVIVAGNGGGGFSIGNITSNSGLSGGDGGIIEVTANVATLLTPTLLQASGSGANSSAGSISLINLGTGGINADPTNFVLGTNGAGGHLHIDASLGNGPISTPGVFAINLDSASPAFDAGSIYVAGTSITSIGSMLFSAGLGPNGSVTLKTSGGDISTGGNSFTITTTGVATVDMTTGKINTSGAAGAAVSIAAAGGISAFPANIDTHSTVANNAGGDVQLFSFGSLSVGDINAIGAGSGPGGDIIITGEDGIFFGTLTTNGFAEVSLTSVDAAINGTAIVSPNVGLIGGLMLDLSGSSPGNMTLTGTSNVGTFRGFGGGLVTINNGSNPMQIQQVGANQSLQFSTTNSATGFTIGNSPISTTGTFVFNTPRFSNGQDIEAASFTIQNLSGDLTVNGVNGIMTGLTPPAGTPGLPSDPTSINFNTGFGAQLQLFGNMTFNGDVTLFNPGGTTTSNTNSLFAGNNNVLLNTLTWTQVTNGNITGNDFNLLGVTLINSDGAVTLSGPMTFDGRDLAIVAKTDINLLNFNLNTSSATGSAGNIVLMAGYNFTPSSGGQVFDPTTYTLNSFNPNGGSITGTGTINLSSTAGDGGSLLVLASGKLDLTNGAVSLGSIDTSSTTGNGGSVLIIAPGGITTGNITTTGATGNVGGDVTVDVSFPQIFDNPGPITVTAGVFSGGIVGVGDPTAKLLSVGSINTGNATIALHNGGPTLNIGGALTGQSFFIGTSRDGTINLPTDTLTVVQDVLGNGGTIALTAMNVVTVGSPTLTLEAKGTTGRGGTVIYDTAGSLSVSSTGDVSIDISAGGAGGLVDIRTDDDLTVDSSGLSALGSSGDGARILLTAAFDNDGILTIGNSAFLDAANAHVAGDGGQIKLSSQLMSFANDINNPLILSANGLGTGSGGSIEYTNADAATTVFGVPAKAPKAPVNFLQAFARAGLSGGNGGQITVATGGSIIIEDPSNTINASASPSGIVNGAHISLTAGNLSGKAGALIINGGMTVDGGGGGAGGSLTLVSNTKTNFQLNTGGKAPKNGVADIVRALGAGGSIEVKNLGGGVQVLTTDAVEAELISLQASGKGSITSGKTTTITSGNTLSLIADLGNIGKKDMLISAADLTLISNSGSVSVSNTFAGPVTLQSGATAGKTFSLKTLGNLTVRDITTVKGEITIVTATGLLTVANSAHINAANAGLLINVTDTINGSILIDDNALVETSGKGKDVVIAIGAPPKKGVNETPPSANIIVNPDPSGKGKAYFDPQNGVFCAPGDTATVTLLGKNVIFSNLSTGGQLITLGDQSEVKADPPIRIPSETGTVSPTHSVMQSMAQAAVPSLSMPSNGSDSAIERGIANIQAVSGLSGSAQINMITSSQISTNKTAGFDAASSSAISLATIDNTVLSSSGSNGEVKTVSATPDDLMVDAVFHFDKHAKNNRHVLADGNAVFAPFIDSIVETPCGTVKIKAGSIALVMHSRDGMAVYDLHDQGKNALVVEAHNKRIGLTPGRHVMVSSHSRRDFSSVNPIELVQYRGLNHSKLENGWSVYTSEFAIPSACYAVKPLRQLMASGDQKVASLSKRILKTTAVLMTLSPDNGDFTQFFKSQVTAMK